ncbi:hypothetical protein [Motilibacter aurantiacus]|uniref:hypothetical protein n=1 Tax=Motilibacter aurantiacus TaxID=2714955 RepID=UPI00140DD4EC|nr:hypothetical protein [Motilibacter aurantiacus]NHC44470.1 hypothetical protein [Motilibacter aurantiacus]
MDGLDAVALRYREHLDDRDLLALTGGRADQVPALRRQPTLLLDLLDRRAVTDPILDDRHADAERFRYVSPFLVFAAAVHSVTGALVGTAYVADRTGPRSRVPVFDGPALAAFATDPRHRLFLIELLTSYSRVASGVAYRQTGRGVRRHRWDELDLPRLAGVLEALPAQQRAAVWRRLGDGALFLAGVFPEHAERALGLVQVARLQRATGLRLRGWDGPVTPLLEELASRAYEHDGVSVPRGVLEAPAAARRVLTLVADRHLFPTAPGWAGAASG